MVGWWDDGMTGWGDDGMRLPALCARYAARMGVRAHVPTHVCAEAKPTTSNHGLACGHTFCRLHTVGKS